MVITGLEYQVSPSELKGQLMNLWEIVFGDEADYISVFLDSSAFQPENTLISLDSGKLSAMLFLLPVCLSNKDKELKGRYIYAVATHPDFRGKGHAGNMLEFAQQLIEKWDEDFTCLHPANISLYQFYQRFGFKTAFYMNEIRNVQGRRDFWHYKIMKVPEGKFRSLYLDTFLKRQEDSLYWKEKTLSFIYQEAKAQNGGALSINGTGFCLYTQPEKETVFVKELVFPSGISNELLDELASFWHGKEVIFRLPVNFGEKNTKKPVLQPFGMIKYRKGLVPDNAALSPAFMGIALD